jgi:hypothetical protein
MIAASFTQGKHITCANVYNANSEERSINYIWVLER